MVKNEVTGLVFAGVEDALKVEECGLRALRGRRGGSIDFEGVDSQ